MTVDYGTDLGCTDDLTDLMVEVSDLTLLAQAAFRRLTTPRGALLGDPDYGLDIRLFLHRALTRAERDAIPGQVRLEILKDRRIAACEVTVTALTPDTISLDIRCETAAGPFSLVVGVEKAGQLIAKAELGGLLLDLVNQAKAA